jgi:CRISPR-associated protein Cas5d
MLRNQIEFVVYGNYALFTDPLTKIGGEKLSYQIDEVRIMNPIRTESKGIRPIEYSGGNTLANYTYLKEVKYQVKSHFIFNPYRADLAFDRNENKHHNIAIRSVAVGGRRDIFLGTRECQGYVEPCVFGNEEGYYDGYGEIDLGVMVHGLNYPDETGKNVLETRLWRPIMKDGIVTFIRPDECTLIRTVGEMPKKEFNTENMQSVEELYEEVILERGD